MKPFFQVYDCPSGFLITTSQMPVPASAGIANVQVINSGDETEMPDAEMEVSPDFTKLTVAPDTKFFPSSAVIDTVAPVGPFTGSISVILGAAADEVVAVVTIVVVFVVVLATVVIVVGVPMGTADTSTVPTFSVYRVSIVDLPSFSVFELILYPQLPSLLG